MTPDVLDKVERALQPFATALERYKMADYDMIYLFHEKLDRLNVLSYAQFQAATEALAALRAARKEE